jgi:hypothetical protein
MTFILLIYYEKINRAAGFAARVFSDHSLPSIMHAFLRLIVH